MSKYAILVFSSFFFVNTFSAFAQLEVPMSVEFDEMVAEMAANICKDVIAEIKEDAKKNNKDSSDTGIVFVGENKLKTYNYNLTQCLNSRLQDLMKDGGIADRIFEKKIARYVIENNLEHLLTERQFHQEGNLAPLSSFFDVSVFDNDDESLQLGFEFWPVNSYFSYNKVIEYIDSENISFKIEILVRGIGQAIMFLTDYHKFNLGAKTSLLFQIEGIKLVSLKKLTEQFPWVDSPIVFRDKVLLVGINEFITLNEQSLFNSDSPLLGDAFLRLHHSADDILQAWESGSVISIPPPGFLGKAVISMTGNKPNEEDMIKMAIRDKWFAIDPTGFVRTKIRNVVLPMIKQMFLSDTSPISFHPMDSSTVPSLFDGVVPSSFFACDVLLNSEDAQREYYLRYFSSIMDKHHKFDDQYKTETKIELESANLEDLKWIEAEMKRRLSDPVNLSNLLYSSYSKKVCTKTKVTRNALIVLGLLNAKNIAVQTDITANIFKIIQFLSGPEAVEIDEFLYFDKYQELTENSPCNSETTLESELNVGLLIGADLLDNVGVTAGVSELSMPPNALASFQVWALYKALEAYRIRLPQQDSLGARPSSGSVLSGATSVIDI